MINILKLKPEDGAKIFFFSDPHINHAKLLDSRGFSTIEEHDETIIKNWNSVVDNESTIFMLGDMVLGAGEKSMEVYLSLLSRLNFKRLYAMQGNHGAAYKRLFNNSLKINQIDEFYRLRLPLQTQYELGAKMGDIENKVVYFIPNYYEIFIGNIPLVLSHYPILSWNGIRANSIMLFGHCHNSLEKTDWVKNNYLIGKCMDVGYESIKKPISFNEVQDIMKTRHTIKVDHH
jgi:calcineurin-like phosphoesterase family protein